MKRNANILLSALLVVVGCTAEDLRTGYPENNQQILVLEATREVDPETRTMRDEESGSVLWVPGDAISLFYGSGANGGSKFTSTLESGSSEMTNFTGTITAITGGGELTVDDTYFWGVYPDGEDVSCDGQGVTLTVPTSQEATPGTFAPNTFPSVGRSQGLIMGFYNICGGWRFSVTKEGIKKVTLKSNGGEIITGKVKVKFDASGVPVIEEVLDGSDEVVLEAPSGEYFEVGKNYYMVLLPTVFESGFTMTFETFTESGEYNRTKKTTIARSKFSGIANLDNFLTTPYAKKTGPIPVEDANFKAYLVENFDTDSDGEISYEEALEITEIAVETAATTNSSLIRSCQGIEYMENLVDLSCDGDYDQVAGVDCYAMSFGLMDKLDLTNNHALKYLSCSGNRIEQLDISKNLELELLDCSGNQLSKLDVSNNLKLTFLHCNGNNLEELDVSNNAYLSNLSCWFNQISSLDVSKNLELSYLGCYHNNLRSLDISKNTNLISLVCTFNQIPNLDVSNCSSLKALYCGKNSMTSLDVSNNAQLRILCFDWNYINEIDLSNNLELLHLDCTDNGIAELDITNNIQLSRLYCLRNQLTSLDISNNTNLQELECSYNLLTSLDVSNNPSLTKLWCFNNLLMSLDVSKNTLLTDFDCSPMNDSAGNNLLSVLYIAQGQQIPNVTVDRNVEYVPAETMIMAAPKPGTNEGTEDEELTP